MIRQLRVRLEVAAAAALGHGALDVPGEPLPGVVEVQDVLAAQAKGREAAGHARLLLVLGLVGARHADDLEADDAAGQVAAAVGAADAGVDAGGEQRVARLERRGRGRRTTTAAAAAAVNTRDAPPLLGPSASRRLPSPSPPLRMFASTR